MIRPLTGRFAAPSPKGEGSGQFVEGSHQDDGKGEVNSGPSCPVNPKRFSVVGCRLSIAVPAMSPVLPQSAGRLPAALLSERQRDPQEIAWRLSLPEMRDELPRAAEIRCWS